MSSQHLSCSKCNSLQCLPKWPSYSGRPSTSRAATTSHSSGDSAEYNWDDYSCTHSLYSYTDFAASEDDYYDNLLNRPFSIVSSRLIPHSQKLSKWQTFKNLLARIGRHILFRRSKSSKSYSSVLWDDRYMERDIIENDLEDGSNSVKHCSKVEVACATEHNRNPCATKIYIKEPICIINKQI